MPKLQFRGDGTFTIVQFTDVHWMDGSNADEKTNRLMQMILQKENPDLVVFTGDTVYSPGSSEPIKMLRKALEPVVKSNIPFAMVFGNHDTENGPKKETLLAVQQEEALCLTQKGKDEISGEGNYLVEVEDSTGENTPWILYFVDSGMLNPNERIGGFDFIKRDQIDWYIKESEKKKEQLKYFSALCFFHIPLPEYNDVWNLRTCYGEKNENVCCSQQNSGMFSAMLEMGNVRGVFVGHDHINDYWGELYGIKLCYGRATGYNTYGKANFAHGARIIRLHEKQESFETWIRLDDGSAVKEQPKHEPK